MPSSRPIIILPLQAVYVPIPKAACTSIKCTIADQLNVKYDKSNPDSVHSSRFRFGKIDKLPTYKQFRFTVVRNPLSRLVSCYKNKIAVDKLPRYMAKYKQFRPNMPFIEFANAVCNIPDEKAEDHFVSQHKFFCDKDIINVDFVGKLESLTDDWKQICAKLEVNLPLRHANQTSETHLTYYNDQLYHQVKQRYAKDIELFGYNV